MPFCNALGFPALDFTKLVADGGIPNELFKILNGEPSSEEINNPEPGQRFEKVVDPYGEDIWVERRKLLPAEFMIWQVQYRTRKNSNNETIGEVGGGPTFGFLGAGAGILADTIANTRRTGGISFSETKFAIHVMESSVRYDMPVPVTVEGGRATLRLPGYVLGVLSVTDAPLNLVEEQKLRVGRNDQDRYRSGIVSNPDGNGQVEVDIMDEIYGSRAEFDEQNRFRTIVRDERIHWFRADNNTNSNYVYAWANNDENFNDVTSDLIEIDPSGLVNNQIVYVTAELVKKRRYRTLVNHKGKTFDASILGSATPTFFEFGANFKAFNFQISKWRVPRQWNNEPVELSDAFASPLPPVEDRSWDEVSGWRISEVMLGKEHDIITADRRGIIRLNKDGGLVATLLTPAQMSGTVRSWFDTYLADRNLIESDIVANESLYFGAMFDLSEHVNSALTDQEKIPYDRRFAMALMSAPDNLGIPNIDLVIREVDGRDAFDARSAVFVAVEQISFFLSAYQSKSCGGAEDASFYDPRDPNYLWNPFIPTPSPEILTDFVWNPPALDMRFARQTRLFCEYYLAIGPSVLERGKSLFYIYTIPIQEGVISIDTDPRNDEAYLLFEDEQLQALAYHRFNNRITDDIRRAPMNNLGQTHEIQEFSHNNTRLVGYDRLIGTLPGFNHGQPLSIEIFEACSGRASFLDIFEERSFPFSQEGNRIIVDNEPNMWFKRLIIDYSADNVTPLRDPFVSLYFQSEDLVIDNIVINVPASPDSNIRRLGIDSSLYRGSKLQIEGSILEQLNIERISGLVSDEPRIGEYVLKGATPSVVIDRRRNIYVFYSNRDSGNIDVAVSGDSGRSWFVQTSILRLASGETADLPYVVPDRYSGAINLFYRLNQQSLMLITIDPSLIDCEDAAKSYEPPEAYDVSYDDDMAIEQYSERGRRLRKLPSIFVVADMQDAYVAEQINITITRQQFNDGRSFRFAPPQNAEQQLDMLFEASSISAYRDSRGGIRICFEIEGKFYVTRCSSPYTWIWEVRGALVHRNIEQAEPVNLPISAPSFVYSPLMESVYFFYFYDDALFVRIFDDAQIRPNRINSSSEVEGIEGARYVSQNLKEQYEEFSNSRTKPWFLCGRLPSELLQALDGTSGATPFAQFAPESPVTFDMFEGDDYGVDIGTPVVGYFTKEGLLRAFYKSQEGQILALSFNGASSSLDIHRSYNPNSSEA